MKSKFMAGFIATLIALVFVVGFALMMVLVFDLDAENKPFTYGAAFGAIAIWMGIYNWLKPKDPDENQNKDEYTAPPRETNI